MASTSPLIEQLAGSYSREAIINGDSSEPLLAPDDSRIEAEAVRQELRISAKSGNRARVQFKIQGAQASRPSCSGQEIFRVSADGKRLVFGFDLEDGSGLVTGPMTGELESTSENEGMDSACSMSLSLNKAGALELKSSLMCKIELCGAGQSLDQDENGTVFLRQQK